ncbi:MAG: GntR family transcriptional regulator [Anaerolineaceae bacterium]|nr:GntR family transcriptional regulator [Anaerolineaceae bacterium]
MNELKFELDFRTGAPIYEQIVEQVRNRIDSGALRPGDQLPTVRQLALELRVNFNTIARAYRILDEAGLISTQQGRGTYILEPDTPEAQSRLRRARLDDLISSLLSDASRHGYTLEEISEEVHAQLQIRREHDTEIQE